MKARVDLFLDDLRGARMLLSGAMVLTPEQSSALARYACVNVNGCFEDYFKNRFIDCMRPRTDTVTLSIVSRQVANYYNFKKDKILLMYRDLWPAREPMVREFLSGSELFSDALGSIVGNKNLVGHSRSSSVSPRQVLGWIQQLEKDIEGFEIECFS